MTLENFESLDELKKRLRQTQEELSRVYFQNTEFYHALESLVFDISKTMDFDLLKPLGPFANQTYAVSVSKLSLTRAVQLVQSRSQRL